MAAALLPPSATPTFEGTPVITHTLTQDPLPDPTPRNAPPTRNPDTGAVPA